MDEFLIEASYTLFNVELAVAIIYTALNIDLFPESSHQINPAYAPTPIEIDIQALFQTYLI